METHRWSGWRWVQGGSPGGGQGNLPPCSDAKFRDCKLGSPPRGTSWACAAFLRAWIEGDVDAGNTNCDQCCQDLYGRDDMIGGGPAATACEEECQANPGAVVRRILRLCRAER